MTRTIVCYGDSNSYGTPGMPDLDFWGRFGPGERWPGVMRDRLGAGFSVIEEGLPGRTTVHDDPIEGAHKNGLKVLPAILESHRPIDLVVIMLGTNDLKARFAVTPEDIAASVGVLALAVKASPNGPDGRAPDVLVVAPPVIIEAGALAGMFRGGAEKSKALGPLVRGVAERLGLGFVNGAALVDSDPVDGIHLTREAHAVLGDAIAQAVRERLG